MELLNSTGTKIILTDREFSENHIIYNNFREYNNLTFYAFSKYDLFKKSKDLYVLINNEEFDVPYFISSEPALWEKDYDSKKLLIYKKIK